MFIRAVVMAKVRRCQPGRPRTDDDYVVKLFHRLSPYFYVTFWPTGRGGEAANSARCGSLPHPLPQGAGGPLAKGSDARAVPFSR